MVGVAEPVPVHGGWPVLGALPGLRRDVLGELEKASLKGDLVRLALPALPPVFLMTHPDGVRQMLQTRSDNYGRTPFHDRLKPVLGEGLLTADGEAWARQRKLLQPHFSAASVRRFVPTIAGVVHNRCSSWAASGPAGATVDMGEEMSTLTLEIILRCMFGRAATDDIGWAIRIAQSEVADRFWRPIDWPSWLPTPANRRFQAALDAMDAAVDRILDERTGGEGHDDLLRSLETAYAPDACPVGQRRAGKEETRLLRDEAMTTLLAGHETSAVGLAWALHVLARHQDVASEVRAEARATFGDAGPSAEEAGTLVQTRAVVNEAMRLYPPAPWFGRRARADDELLGQPIPAGALVLFSPWLLHRDERWWPDPLAFDPGRFQGERNKTRRPWSFLPFGGGPRSCIGLNLAMTEMTVALAMIVRNFDLVPTNDPTPRPEALITLRPAGPLRVTLEPVGETGD